MIPNVNEAITLEQWHEQYGNGRKPKRTKRNPEAAVQRAILEYLQYHPAVAKVWRNNAGKIKTESGGLVNMSPAGTSDIIGFLKDGRFLAVEVKAGKNQPTDLQQEFIDSVNAAGGIGFVAWSVDDCEKGLEASC